MPPSSPCCAQVWMMRAGYRVGHRCSPANTCCPSSYVLPGPRSADSWLHPSCGVRPGPHIAVSPGRYGVCATPGLRSFCAPPQPMSSALGHRAHQHDTTHTGTHHSRGRCSSGPDPCGDIHASTCRPSGVGPRGVHIFRTSHLHARGSPSSTVTVTVPPRNGSPVCTSKPHFVENGCKVGTRCR